MCSLFQWKMWGNHRQCGMRRNQLVSLLIGFFFFPVEKFVLRRRNSLFLSNFFRKAQKAWDHGQIIIFCQISVFILFWIGHNYCISFLMTEKNVNGFIIVKSTLFQPKHKMRLTKSEIPPYFIKLTLFRLDMNKLDQGPLLALFQSFLWDNVIKLNICWKPFFFYSWNRPTSNAVAGDRRFYGNNPREVQRVNNWQNRNQPRRLHSRQGVTKLEEILGKRKRKGEKRH